MPGSGQPFGPFAVLRNPPLSDPSAWSLLAANLITIVVAIWGRWELAPLMWIYWGQSCIIGWFNFCRMLGLEKFSTEDVEFNDRPVSPTRMAQIGMSFFFLAHYGFFHFGYLMFLREGRALPEEHKVGVLICIGVFFINHLFSFLHNLEGDRRQQRNIGKVMMFPYARILPMHLTIIVGGHLAGGPVLLLLFLVLKTLADLTMHTEEHKQKDDPVLEGSV